MFYLAFLNDVKACRLGNVRLRSTGDYLLVEKAVLFNAMDYASGCEMNA